MNGKVHAICGVSLAVATAIAIPTVSALGTDINPWIGVPAAWFGSLIPDIDIEQSKMGHKVKIFSKIFTHRGFTHTLMFPLAFCFLGYFFSWIPLLPSLIFGLVIGYLSHIFADMFNSKGVPLLWPVIKGKIHIASIKTASTVQQVIFIILWEAGLLIWIFLQYDIFSKIQEFMG